MGISTTPVKEALRKLEQEGFIVGHPRRGAVVGPLVLTPPAEILELRADLEGMAARLAAKKMSEVQLKALRDQVVELRRCSLFVQSDPTALVNATYDFHQQIIAAAGNAFISRFLGTLAPFDRTVLRIETIVPQEAAQDAGEHQAICDAIQSRDGATAERMMHHHIERVIDDLFGGQ